MTDVERRETEHARLQEALRAALAERDGWRSRVLAIMAALDPFMRVNAVEPMFRDESAPEAPVTAAVSVGAIIRAVAARFDVSADDLISDRQSRRIAAARRLAVLIAREATPHTSTGLGRLFRRDRTTIEYSVGRARLQLRRDAQYRGHDQAVRKSLRLATGDSAGGDTTIDEVDHV
jgi:chromosomal replication initiation ATPase DnaA